MLSSKTQQLETELSNCEQVLKATYQLVDQLKADQVYESTRYEQSLSEMKAAVALKDEQIAQLEASQVEAESKTGALVAKIGEEELLRKNLETQLKISTEKYCCLSSQFDEANATIEQLNHAIVQNDIVHWRVIDSLKNQHAEELCEVHRIKADALSYAESELKMTSEYFEEARKLEAERHRAIVDELTYDIGRLRTATISFIDDSSPGMYVVVFLLFFVSQQIPCVC
jgi:chromosome segregation ATPase